MYQAARSRLLFMDKRSMEEEEEHEELEMEDHVVILSARGVEEIRPN
jgi:hypothetical protein